MKKTFILIVLPLLVMLGCKKSFLNINQNPNQPTTVTPNVVLSAALAGSANNIATDFLKVNNLMGYWSRSGNYVPDAQTESYNIPNDYTDLDWANVYNTLNSYDYIEKQGQANDLPFYIGVAKTMKALHFSTLVDVYGDVPYTDAFNVSTNVQPKYDKGQDIYNDLVKQLDSAVFYFDRAKVAYTAPGASSAVIKTDDQYDIMFGQSKGTSPSVRMDKWVSFANTLKLKLLIHEYKVADPAYITNEIDSINANGRGFIMANQSASVNPAYTLSTNQLNPFVGDFQTATGGPSNNAAYFRANNYAVNFYLNTGDERQLSFYVPTAGTTVGGNYDGDPNSLPNGQTSAIGGGFGGTIKSPSQSQLIISDFESLFLQAEATQRGWLTGNAQSLDSLAVTQNFIYLDPNAGATSSTAGDNAIDASDAATYLSGAGLGLSTVTEPQYVVWGDQPDKIKFILTQKWAALNGINWVEAWTDYRRTGIPTSDVLGLSHAPTHIQPAIPVRYPYPQTELTTNAANVPASPNIFTDPPFWAK
jgi:Starch-binding associating with outer membrane